MQSEAPLHPFPQNPFFLIPPFTLYEKERAQESIRQTSFVAKGWDEERGKENKGREKGERE